jgi:large subunit ribosomal protein L21
MYAIVKTGGKQYRVEKGQTLLVERLPEDAGASVSLEPVLFRSDDVVFDADGLAKVKVSALVVEHVRGEKLRVFKFKPKRGYRRTAGHRQELTRIEVTEIKQLSRRPAARKSAADGDDAQRGAPKRASRSGRSPAGTVEATPASEASPAEAPSAEAADTPDAELATKGAATSAPAAEAAAESEVEPVDEATRTEKGDKTTEKDDK